MLLLQPPGRCCRTFSKRSAPLTQLRESTGGEKQEPLVCSAALMLDPRCNLQGREQCALGRVLRLGRSPMRHSLPMPAPSSWSSNCCCTLHARIAAAQDAPPACSLLSCRSPARSCGSQRPSCQHTMLRAVLLQLPRAFCPAATATAALRGRPLHAAVVCCQPPAAPPAAPKAPAIPPVKRISRGVYDAAV